MLIVGEREPMMKVNQLLRGVALVSMLLALGLTGCKDKGAATAPPAGDGDALTEVDQPRVPDNTNRKGTGEGWRWKGEREHCRFLVDNECFKVREDACSAADCPGSACFVSSAIPAQVTCE